LKAMEKGDAKEEAQFTDAQLLGMIEEHQDDPSVMLQIMKQVSKQTAGNEAETKLLAAEMTQRKKEMDSYLTATWPDIHDEGSENYQNVQSAKEMMNVAEHPLGDFLGAASMMFMQMPQMLENAKKEAREEALKGNTEIKRKQNIKANSLEQGKKKESSSVQNSNFNANVKQFGMNKSTAKIYAQILKDSAPATVEV